LPLKAIEIKNLIYLKASCRDTSGGFFYGLISPFFPSNIHGFFLQKIRGIVAFEPLIKTRINLIMIKESVCPLTFQCIH
jgi:hypothetical protein